MKRSSSWWSIFLFLGLHAKHLHSIILLSEIVLAFWLVLTCYQKEDRPIDDTLTFVFVSLLNETNRFHVRPQNCQNVVTSLTQSALSLCANLLFLSPFDIICGQLLNRHVATWNLFVKFTTSGQIRYDADNSKSLKARI